MRRHLLAACLLCALPLRAQDSGTHATPATPDTPAANPARPTVTNPATLPPVGYLQFEQGFVQANNTAEFDSQFSLNVTAKIAVTDRLMPFVQFQPFANSNISPSTQKDAGDLAAGLQFVLFKAPDPPTLRPTVAIQYARLIHAGTAPNTDIGGFTNSAVLLISGDIPGLHYDTNYIVNEQTAGPLRRAQFGQTLSVTHNLTKTVTLSGELWHFTQPLTAGNAVGTLYALAWSPKPNLVFDAGFERGLTSTSTQWQGFAGLTYLLPHRLWKQHSK